MPTLLCVQWIAPFPFINHIAHGFILAIFDPGHKGPVELEMGPAFLLHKTPNILRVLVAARYLGMSADPIRVPIKAHNGILDLCAFDFIKD